MKKLFLLLITSLYVAACQNNTNFKLQADLGESLPDTVWMVYDDPTVKIDTIYPENGSFTYTIQTDTLSLCRLLSPDGQTIPVFIYPEWNVKIKGSLSEPVIQGDGPNGEYGAFLQEILPLKKDSTAIRQAVSRFVKSHLQSFASAYIINQYYIQSPNTNIDKLRDIIAPLDGNVKDCHILNSILQEISNKNRSASQAEYVSYFACKDRNGKYISWNNTEDSYTLINFWASWDKQSLIIRDSLAQMAPKLPEKQFRVLNLSLDYIKKEWIKSCKKDSEQWIEICDFKAWENQVVKQNNVYRLPANILVDRNRKIVTKNIYGQELYQKVKSLTAPKKDK